MRVIEKGGISTIIANILHPVLKILFPQIQRSKKALGAIAMSMSANFLGLGNAATPLGINAMKELSLINRSHSIIDASDEMCMFVVLNTSGLQLIPATIIALRSASGSQDPGGIMLPIWICSIFSVFVGIIAVKIFKGIHKKKSMKNRY
jgi:spore maturation protein A